METPNLTILTEEQVKGPNRLKIFDVIDPRAALSDTAILRGACASDCHIPNNINLSGRTGEYWLKTEPKTNCYYYKVSCVGANGNAIDTYEGTERNIGSRLVLPATFIMENAYNITTEPNNLEKALFGYYSGYAVEEKMQTKLESMYKSNSLTILGKGCTFDGRKYDDYNNKFLPEEIMYYGYKGNVYARVRANSCETNIYAGVNSLEKFALSNGLAYKNGDYVWTKIIPIIWERHSEDDWFITEQIINAGVKFKEDFFCYNGNFDGTVLKWYYDNYLSKDLINPIVNKYINDYKKEKDQKEMANNLIFKDKDEKIIKKVQIKVKTKNAESN